MNIHQFEHDFNYFLTTFGSDIINCNSENKNHEKTK